MQKARRAANCATILSQPCASIGRPSGARSGSKAPYDELPGDDWPIATSTAGLARSQAGAAVSAQSRPLGSREELVAAAADLERRFPGEMPRPEYWRGYVLHPRQIEFWQDGEFRLHDRMLFARAGDAWTKTRLYP